MFYDFITYLSESTQLLGSSRLFIFAGLLLVCGILGLWVTSLILNRGGNNLFAAFASTIILVLLGGLTGLVYVTNFLSDISGVKLGLDAGLSLVLCAAISIPLIFLAVHGSFDTPVVKSVILTVVMIVCVGGAAYGGIRIFPNQEKQNLDLLAKQVMAKPTEGPWLVKSETATKRIKIKLAPLEKAELLQRQQMLVGTYNSLAATRAQLKTDDPAAVNAFNQQAAAYAAEVQAVNDGLAKVNALIPPEIQDEDEEALDEE